MSAKPALTTTTLASGTVVRFAVVVNPVDAAAIRIGDSPDLIIVPTRIRTLAHARAVLAVTEAVSCGGASATHLATAPLSVPSDERTEQ